MSFAAMSEVGQLVTKKSEIVVEFTENAVKLIGIEVSFAPKIS